MIKSIHHRNINQTASLVFFLSTTRQKKAIPTIFIFSHAPNSIYAFNNLQKHLSSINKTAQQKLLNSISHGSII